MFQSKNNSNFKTCKDNSSWRVINPQYFASVPLVAMVQVIIPSSTIRMLSFLISWCEFAVEFSYKFHPWRWMVELGFLWESYISGLGFFMVRFSFVTNSKNEGYLYQAGCFDGWCLPWRCCLYTSLGWNYVSEWIWNDLPTSNSHKQNESLYIYHGKFWLRSFR